jgi:hypothetical protein
MALILWAFNLFYGWFVYDCGLNKSRLKTEGKSKLRHRKKFRRLRNSAASFILQMVLEGRRIAPGASRGRKVRTPQGAMLRNSSPFD